MNATYTPPEAVQGTVTIELSEQEAMQLYVLAGSLTTTVINQQLTAAGSATRRLAKANNVEAYSTRRMVSALYYAISEALNDKINTSF